MIDEVEKELQAAKSKNLKETLKLLKIVENSPSR